MKKLLLIILTSFTLQTSFAQADQHWLLKKISLSVKRVPIEEVLKLLEKDMEGVVFAYSPGTFDVKKLITIDAREKPLNEILHQIFEKQRLELAEMRGKIFLKKKKKINSGKQSSTPVRRKRILKADVRKVPVDTALPSRKTQELPKGQREEVVQVNVTPDAEATTTETSIVQATKKGKAVSPSPAMMALVEEVTSSARVPSTPVYKSIKPIDKTRIVSGNLYSHESLSQPDLPPIPLDSALIRTEDAKVKTNKADREKKKKEKKEKPEKEPEEKKLRFYVAPNVALTSIRGDAAIKVGGKIVWLKNSRLGIGLAGWGMQGARADDAVLSNDAYRLVGGYGGFLLEYTFSPSKGVHLSFPVVTGLGAITYMRQDIGISTLTSLPTEDERVIGFVEPGVLLELNVIKYIKVAFEFSYRYTTFSELNYADSGEVILKGSGLNAFSGGVTVKFGIF